MSQYRQKTIATVFRILSKPLTVLLAGTLAAPTYATPAQAELKTAKRTLPAFFDELGRDMVLRARFAQNPREVLAEHGLDLPNFVLPDRFTDIEIDRLLKRWPAVIDPTLPAWQHTAVKSVTDAQPREQPQSGHSLTAGSRASGDVGNEDVAEQPRFDVPMPVYGPPAGPRRDLPRHQPRTLDPTKKDHGSPTPDEELPSDQRQ